jgi:hypothetical protein
MVGIWESGDSKNWQQLGVVTDTNWQITNIGDYNNNSTSDILWRNQATGLTGMWESGNSTQWQELGSASADWKIQIA